MHSNIILITAAGYIRFFLTLQQKELDYHTSLLKIRLVNIHRNNSEALSPVVGRAISKVSTLQLNFAKSTYCRNGGLHFVELMSR